MGLRAISTFAGVGGLDIAAEACGIETVCYVEYDPYAQAVLMSRIRDGRLRDAPIHSDIRTFPAKRLRGIVDIMFGGFPCQPHSLAGHKLGGADERNLWPDTLRVLRESGAWGFVGENVTGIIANGFAAQVMADLEQAGFCGAIFSNTACAYGAPHARERVFFIAHSTSIRRIRMEEECQSERPAVHQPLLRQGFSDAIRILLPLGGKYGNPSSGVRRNDDGLAEGMDRLRCVGNGVCPHEAVPAFKKLLSWGGV